MTIYKTAFKTLWIFFHNKSAGSEQNLLKVCRYVRFFWLCRVRLPFLVKTGEKHLRFYTWNFYSQNAKKLANASFSGTISISLHKYGAGDRTWTCTVLPIDPKSIASANSATPAYKTTLLFYHKLPTLSRPFAQKNARCSKHRTDFFIISLYCQELSACA